MTRVDQHFRSGTIEGVRLASLPEEWRGSDTTITHPGGTGETSALRQAACVSTGREKVTAMSSAGAPHDPDVNDPAPLLTVTLSRPLAGIAVCTAAGEVDLSTAPLLGQHLHEAISSQPQRLVVNLSAVTFFSAAGVGALDDARAAQCEEHELVLVGESRVLVRVLDVCDVGYPRYCDLDRALAASNEDVSA